MKTGFYAVYRSKDKGKHKTSLGLLKFIKSLSGGKTSLSLGNNYLYIHSIGDKTFLFTKTNDKSLVQKTSRWVFHPSFSLKGISLDSPGQFTDQQLPILLIF